MELLKLGLSISATVGGVVKNFLSNPMFLQQFLMVAMRKEKGAVIFELFQIFKKGKISEKGVFGFGQNDEYPLDIGEWDGVLKCFAFVTRFFAEPSQQGFLGEEPLEKECEGIGEIR